MSEIPKPTFTPYQALFYGCGTNYQHCKEDCYWYEEEPNMGAHIPYCQNKGGNYIEPKDCENCEHYHSKYKKTNADRIRAMTDEELADWLACIENKILEKQPMLERAAVEADWLEWLKEEVKDGSTRVFEKV